jgi:hypothetical protein
MNVLVLWLVKSVKSLLYRGDDQTGRTYVMECSTGFIVRKYGIDGCKSSVKKVEKQRYTTYFLKR